MTEETERDESAFVCHVPCDNCGSRDNAALYGSGRTHCHGCDKTVFPEGYKPGLASERPPSNYSFIRGQFLDVSDKYGVDLKTMRKHNVQIVKYAIKERDEDGEVQQLPAKNCLAFTYYDKEGAIWGQKIRYPLGDGDKTFRFPNAGGKVPIYGMHEWPSKPKKTLLLVGGEGDKLAYEQVTNGSWACGSFPKGEKAMDSIKDWFEEICQFEDIVICLDNDKTGREMAPKVAELLPQGKVRIGFVDGFKDMRDALKAGATRAITNAFYNAKPYRPDGIISVDDELIDEACAPAVFGTPWPWQRLTDITMGVRYEIYMLGGGVGCGKTEVFKELVHHFTNLGEKCGLMFLEERPSKTLKVLAGKRGNKRYHLPTTQYEPAELRGHVEWFKGRLELYNHFGAKDWASIKLKIRYMVTVLGIKRIFLDHLTALTAQCGSAGEVNSLLDSMMADLASMVEELEFTLFCISHLTTPKQGKPHEEGGRVLEMQFTGGRAIARWAHNMMGIERDKQQPGRPTVVRILKERESGDASGLKFGLSWNPATGMYDECDAPEDDDGDHRGGGFQNHSTPKRQLSDEDMEGSPDI